MFKNKENAGSPLKPLNFSNSYKSEINDSVSDTERIDIVINFIEKSFEGSNKMYIGILYTFNVKKVTQKEKTEKKVKMFLAIAV